MTGAVAVVIVVGTTFDDEVGSDVEPITVYNVVEPVVEVSVFPFVVTV